tara:strand:- start:3586 stop:3753 length:168 start_codon:yes stop_codon:yes gene_type:complete
MPATVGQGWVPNGSMKRENNGNGALQSALFQGKYKASTAPDMGDGKMALIIEHFR